MHRTVLHIFTFHDHLFKVVSETTSAPPCADPAVVFVEDEYGTQAPLDDPTDLKSIRERCGQILQGYREEMEMPTQGVSQ